MTIAKRRPPIEREVLDVDGIGEIVCLRQTFDYGANGTLRREASASRLGVFEWNANAGGYAWYRLPIARVEARPRFHVRSELRARALEEYRRIVAAAVAGEKGERAA